MLHALRYDGGLLWGFVQYIIPRILIGHISKRTEDHYKHKLKGKTGDFIQHFLEIKFSEIFFHKY